MNLIDTCSLIDQQMAARRARAEAASIRWALNIDHLSMHACTYVAYIACMCVCVRVCAIWTSVYPNVYRRHHRWLLDTNRDGDHSSACSRDWHTGSVARSDGLSSFSFLFRLVIDQTTTFSDKPPGRPAAGGSSICNSAHYIRPAGAYLIYLVIDREYVRCWRSTNFHCSSD
jgi:hypothetical protein